MVEGKKCSRNIHGSYHVVNDLLRLRKRHPRLLSQHCGRWNRAPTRAGAGKEQGWPGPQAFIHEEPKYYQRLMHTPTLAKPWNGWLLAENRRSLLYKGLACDFFLTLQWCEGDAH